MDLSRHPCPHCGGAGGTWTWWSVPGDLERLADYCAQDVVVESEVDATALHLSANERIVWERDQLINDRGIQLDRPLIERAQKIVELAKATLDKRMRELTNNEVPKATQTAALAVWINSRGVPCTTVRKGAQEELLLHAEANGVPEVVEAIEIRRAASKTSTAKLWSMIDCMCADDRARGLLHYHGASTGRWAGRLIQPQNLYRVDEERDGRDIERVIEILQRDLPPQEAHDQIEIIVGEPMELIAKSMRRFIIAKPGRKLVGGDLSNIEGCVNVWLAGEEWKIKAYQDYQNRIGPDLYKLAYAKSFNVPPEEVVGQKRQIGKVMELALGYQGSVGAFYTMSQTYLLKLSTLLPIIQEATDPATWDKALWLYSIAPAMRRYGLPRELWAGLKVIVDNWRAAHPRTVQSWWDQQDAAIAAVAAPGEVTSCCDGKIQYVCDRGFLWCQLPSGRMLAYCRPYLNTKDDSFLMLEDNTRVEADEYTDVEITALKKVPGIEYHQRIRKQVLYEGYAGATKKWGTHALYGGLQAENNVSGIARDILVGGMLRAEDAGYPVVLTVHDELLTEPLADHGSPAELQALMVQGEPWTAGLPLAAKAWEDMRYVK